MDTIYYGGRILTMEDELIFPEAVLVKNGLIRKVGSLKEVMDAAGTSVKKINLKGKCLMPGFIDSHSHIVLNGQMAMFADLSECRDFHDVQAVMSAFIKENQISPQNVAVGFGYDNNFLNEQEHPGKAVLDQVSEEIPIMLIHVSGHIGCVNSVMLRLADITAETENPQGGKIRRIEGSHEPDGVLEESAMMSVQNSMSKRLKPDLRKLFGGMQKVYVENGITTAQEGAANKSNLSMLKMAQVLGKLQIDVVVYPLISDGGSALLKKNKKLLAGYRKHIRMGGYKMLLDGSPQGRTAWMSEPYLGGDDPEYCGYPWLSDEETYNYCLQAINENRQILTHCNGDAASEQFLQAYAQALEVSTNENKANLRPVMIHCQTVRNDQLDRMAKLNMLPSVFVGHVYYWGDVHVKNFGQERGHHISPVKDALDRGLLVNFHQDTPITKPNMMHTVWTAVNRISRQGKVIGAEQKIGVYDALKAITINAAYAYFEEDSKGSIKDGKRADLVILDKCPLDVDTMEIKDIQVLETIKDGKTIYRK